MPRLSLELLFNSFCVEDVVMEINTDTPRKPKVKVDMNPSLDIKSAPAILLAFESDDRGLLMPSAEVLGHKLETEKRKVRPGRRILQWVQADLQELPDDLLRANFVPVQAFIANRGHGIFRNQITFVGKDHLEGRERISGVLLAELHDLVDDYFWDGRLYRNPGETGGNFSLVAELPVPAESVSKADIRALREFELR